MQSYITECVGVEFVGVSVIIWGLSTSLGGFISGLLMRCMTSYIIVMVVVGLGHIGSVVFLLVWTRQPSLEVICIMACIYGLCHGVIFTAAFGKLCLYLLVAMVLASAQFLCVLANRIASVTYATHVFCLPYTCCLVVPFTHVHTMDPNMKMQHY